MAEKQMLLIIQRARAQWNLRHVAMAHRIGVVPIAESSVEIAVSSVHRKEALSAVQFLIDELKAQARAEHAQHTHTHMDMGMDVPSHVGLPVLLRRCRFGKGRCMREKAVLGRRTRSRARPRSADNLPLA